MTSQHHSATSCKFTYPLDEIFGLGADERRYRHIRPSDSPLGHDGCVLERRLTDQKLVSQNPKTPQIHLLTVVVGLSALLQHFRREVVQCSAHCLTSVVGGVNTPAEVTDFDFPVDADENVLWLDVTMHHMLFVQVL